MLEQSRQENAKILGKSKTNIYYYVPLTCLTWTYCSAWYYLHIVLNTLMFAWCCRQCQWNENIVLGIDLEGIPTSDAPLKRSLSIMISKKSLKPHLTRSRSTKSANGKYTYFMTIMNHSIPAVIINLYFYIFIHVNCKQGQLSWHSTGCVLKTRN